MANEEFSKYERARIIGARGLQISMDAPILLKMSDEDLAGVNFDPLKIAERELDSGVLPISVKRPMPQKKDEKLENIRIEESGVSDAEKIKAEKEGTRDIVESGEMVVPEEMKDELEDSVFDSGEGESEGDSE